jgi:peptidoglycan biosynthesis protein MviN/MurJ (putative lipid II flippase)
MDARLAFVLPRIFLATLVMAAALYGVQIPLAGWWSASLAHRAAGLVLLVGGGLGVYALIIVLSRAATRADIAGLLRKERPA